MEPIRIGVLVPYSGIFKRLKQDLRQGLQLGLQGIKSIAAVEYIFEYIHLGETKEVEKAFIKLATYHEADIIVGVIGPKVAYNLLEQINNYKIPTIVLNLGEYNPTYSFRSPYLFYNSLHLWKSEWAMGRWSQLKYGSVPGIGTCLYEAGYLMHEAFRLGSAAVGAPLVNVEIMKPPKPGGIGNINVLLNSLHLKHVGHMHVLLSGKEGAQFISGYKSSHLAQHVPITVAPFMVDECLDYKDKNAEGFYSATTWSLHLETKGNNAFRETYQANYLSSPNAYAMLAYEAGLAMAAVIKENSYEISNKDIFAKSLANSTPCGPRGTIKLTTLPLQVEYQVYIRKSYWNSRTERIENEVVDTVQSVNWDNSDMLNTAYTNESGWLNPYLCV
jgi:hypothetical protein